MFTGIIQAKAAVVSVRETDVCLRVRITKPRSWKLVKGQSISIDGICSTVVAHSSGGFEVEYMPETLLKTTAARFATGSVVNLERSLRYGDYVDGHFVQGHVDCVGSVRSIVVNKDSRTISISIPAKFARGVSLHGSIAINGVSLTVARKIVSRFTIALIPHTLKHTNLGTLAKGSCVNVELDHSAQLIKDTRRATVRRHAKRRIRKI